jgi:UDP-N-acetylmuramate--alanine ligase
MQGFPKHIFFLGIGGIGMSALARFFLDRGHEVYGFDRSRSELCIKLESEGARIQYTEEISCLNEIWKKANADTLVVRTPAVGVENKLLQHFSGGGFIVMKRAEVLGKITGHMQCLAVAGTHGKTTTSSLLAHLFHHAGRKVYAFLGGIATNFDGNYVKGNEETVVVEADEYDRSFLTLQPNTALITNTDSDHLDIYDNPEALTETFRTFGSGSREKGILITRSGIPVESDYTYAAGESQADYRAENIRISEGKYHFDLVFPNGKISDIALSLPGMHNVENAVGAATIALLHGIEPEKVKSGIGHFRGVKRRFEYHLNSGNRVYIDDYAHHPGELEALVKTIGQLYPGKTFALLFQPHLYSRTRDFADGFARVLGSVEHVGLLPVYAAREKPGAGMESSELYDRIRGNQTTLLEKSDIAGWIRKVSPDILVTAGAGDIDECIEEVQTIMQNLSEI